MNIVVFDLWTDLNKGDNSLQVGLATMLRSRFPGATLVGIFRFGYNEFGFAASEISDTAKRFDSALGGIRPTRYSGKFKNQSLISKRIFSAYSFMALIFYWSCYRLGATRLMPRAVADVFAALSSANLIIWKGKNFRLPAGVGGIGRALTLGVGGALISQFGATKACVNASFWEVKNYFAKRILQACFERIELVTVRDRPSIENASSIINHSRIRYCKDLSFYDLAQRSQTRRAGKRGGLSQYSLALTVTSWGTEEQQRRYLQAMKELISDELRCSPGKIVLVPQVTRGAEDASKILEELINLENERIVYIDSCLDIDQLLDIYQSCDCLVGTRMHSCVFAASVGTPFVAIAYDEGSKWDILSDLVDSEFIVPLSNITGAQLIELRRRASLKPFNLAALGELSYKNVEFCNDPLISCSGVMFPKEIAHEYRDGRRDQALDGASEVGAGSGHHSREDHGQ
jgi:polysaccharide pyruvyl transferase WcaK-like protein